MENQRLLSEMSRFSRPSFSRYLEKIASSCVIFMLDKGARNFRNTYVFSQPETKGRLTIQC